MAEEASRSESALAAEDVEEEEAAASDSSPGARPWCARCCRCQTVCICDAMPEGAPLDTRTRIALLVHPREAKSSKNGTLPLLRACLRNLVVHVGDACPSPTDDPGLHQRLTAGGHRCVLVSPGPDAEELRHAATPEAEAGPPQTLIFIDSRWSHAKSLVNRSPWLLQLPRAVLRPTEQSGYRFRQQPAQGCLSTLECVAEALLVLEGERGPALKEGLMAPFRRMVDLVCGCRPALADQNAHLAPDLRPELPLFDAKVHAAPAPPPAAGERVMCLMTWGDRSVAGRDPVVVKVHIGHPQDREQWLEISKRLGAGRPRGQRFWWVQLAKVPLGARYQAAAGST